jgi:hypothetical protein
MSHRADEKRAYPFQHMFYRITPRDPRWAARKPELFTRRDASGQAYCTLGAGPVEGLLTVGFNRPWDLEIPISFEAPAADCTVEEENRRIEALIASARAYNNRVRFSSWPPVNGPGHNCNGLMAALAMSSGMELPAFTRTFMLAPGCERPVEEENFKVC